jgi:ribosome-associated heat shock protein Hsp15
MPGWTLASTCHWIKISPDFHGFDGTADPKHESSFTFNMDKIRIDKWLWAARFYKTRSLATEEVHKGRVQIAGQDVKPAREVKPGDHLTLRQGPVLRTVVVVGISGARGPAPVAQALYAETEASLQARTQAAEQRRLAPEPAHSLEHGRPTKRQRRDLDQLGQDGGWGDRWSASIDG